MTTKDFIFSIPDDDLQLFTDHTAELYNNGLISCEEFGERVFAISKRIKIHFKVVEK